MRVSGFWPVLAVGIVGALIAELLRIAGMYREGGLPKRKGEYLISALYVVLGGGAVFYGIDDRAALEVATLGAAFPALFAAGIRAATEPKETAPPTNLPTKGSLVAYAASRTAGAYRLLADKTKGKEHSDSG